MINKQCPECGKTISDTDTFCKNCGFPLDIQSDNSEDDSSVPVANSNTDEPRHETSNKKPFIIICIISTLLAIGFAVAFFSSKNDVTEPSVDNNDIKKLLIDNTEYVKEHIVGVWEYGDGEILEIYKNGDMINYEPQQDNSIDEESFIFSEIQTCGYGRYSIPDPSSYSDADLEEYAGFIRYLNHGTGTDVRGIKIKEEILSGNASGCSFKDENTMELWGNELIRISNKEPDISDTITGLYNVSDNTHVSFTVFHIPNTDRCYFEWFPADGDQVLGSCTISNDRIILDDENFVFEKDKTCLIEVGTNEFPGSHLKYHKVSDLSYCNQPLSADISNNKTTEDDSAQSTESSPNQSNPDTNNAITTINPSDSSAQEKSPPKIGDEIELAGRSWKILNIQDDKALIVSAYNILTNEECYNKDDCPVTWETCTLRQYLNGEFLNGFSISEKEKIVTTTIVNDDNPDWGTEGGNNTEDKIFLLSIAEAQQYAPLLPDEEGGWSWLRSPGGKSNYAAALYIGGGEVVFDAGGFLVTTPKNGIVKYETPGYGYYPHVQPACWITLN